MPEALMCSLHAADQNLLSSLLRVTWKAVQEAFGASLDWYKANAAQASVPPASASIATADAQGPSTSAQPPAAVDEDEDAGQCVICLAAPSTAGFLHGER